MYFGEKKTLVVVYKDELLMNQLKKLVETNDDTKEGVICTTDDTINIKMLGRGLIGVNKVSYVLT